MSRPNDTLRGEEFGRLLAALDPDRERAGERYLMLRRKLVAFLEWRGAPFPEEATDRALDIAARRIADGEQVRDVPSYCLGIARLVLLESLRSADRERSAAEELAASAGPRPEGEDALRATFGRCLGELPAESRDLILTYYSSEGRAKSDAREQLAARLGIPLNALRIRAYRIRVRLETAVRTALAGDGGKAK